MFENFKNWIKDKWLKTKKFFLTTFGVTAVLAAGSLAPVVDSPMQCSAAFETLTFETNNGSLNKNQYAVLDDEYLYSNGVDGFVYSTSSQDVIVDRKQVGIRAKKSESNTDCVGCSYFKVCNKKNGDIKTIKIEKEKYEESRKNGKKIFEEQEKTNLISKLTPKAQAAISEDSLSISGLGLLASSLSWNHTTSGSDIVMVVGVTTDDSNNTDYIVTSLTYNSVSLTRENYIDQTSADYRSSVWYLANPSTGTHSVSVTFTNLVSGIFGGSITLTGANTSSPVDNSSVKAGSTGNPATTITTNNDNSYIFGVMMNDEFDSSKIGCSDSQKWHGDTSGEYSVGCSKTTTSAGGYTMNFFSNDGNEEYATAIIAINEASAGGGGAEEIKYQSEIWFD